MTGPRRLLAVAAAAGRVAYALLIDGVLCDWGVSRTAARGAKEAEAQGETWFRKLRPEVVITERVGRRSRKSARTRQVIAAIHEAAVNARLLDISIPRIQQHPNKYAEAVVLAERFPEIAAWVPAGSRPSTWCNCGCCLRWSLVRRPWV